MTHNQQRAIAAIKAATGWDAEPSSQGAKVQRPHVTSIYVWYSRSDKWKCEISPKGWTGEGATPEEAIDAVLPRYRAQIASLAADILPGWPKLEWRESFNAHRLVLVVGQLCHTLLLVDTKLWLLSVYSTPGFANVYPERNRTEVLAAMTVYVESLGLPCSLPPFPETPDAT